VITANAQVKVCAASVVVLVRTAPSGPVVTQFVTQIFDLEGCLSLAGLDLQLSVAQSECLRSTAQQACSYAEGCGAQTTFGNSDAKHWRLASERSLVFSADPYPADHTGRNTGTGPSVRWPAGA
jgi:hypothetical protein